MKNAVKTICYHGKILWRGFKRMLYGAATAGLFGIAIYGFIVIPKEVGYIAVCDCVGAIATMLTALACLYHQGCGKKRKGGYEK